jgi:hypothetical protein
MEETPYSRVLLQKQIVTQQVKNFLVNEKIKKYT